MVEPELYPDPLLPLARAWPQGQLFAVCTGLRWLYWQLYPSFEVCVELSSSYLGSVLVVAVHGRLDYAHANAFEAALAPHLVECKLGGTPVVLDFSNVVYISSVGLRVLLLASKQVKAQQGCIAIASLTPIVTEVFQVSHFDLVLRVFPDVAAAAAEADVD